jgi:hypothetical protein
MFLLNSIPCKPSIPTELMDGSANQKYLRLLLLAKDCPDVRLVPNHEIDEILHAHLADEGKFDKDCQKFFGTNFNVTHNAGFGTQGDREEWLDAFDQTKTLFEARFGVGTMGNSRPAACNLLIKSVNVRHGSINISAPSSHL